MKIPWRKLSCYFKDQMILAGWLAGWLGRAGLGWAELGWAGLGWAGLGWLAGWLDGWMDGWDGWMEGYRCFLQPIAELR